MKSKLFVPSGDIRSLSHLRKQGTESQSCLKNSRPWYGGRQEMSPLRLRFQLRSSGWKRNAGQTINPEARVDLINVHRLTTRNSGLKLLRENPKKLIIVETPLRLSMRSPSLFAAVDLIAAMKPLILFFDDCSRVSISTSIVSSHSSVETCRLASLMRKISMNQPQVTRLSVLHHGREWPRLFDLCRAGWSGCCVRYKCFGGRDWRRLCSCLL